MDFKVLKAAHDAEIQEAGVIPEVKLGVLMPQENLIAAFRKYRKLMDSSAFYKGFCEGLKSQNIEKEARDNLARAAVCAEQRVIGAKEILIEMGFDMNKYEGSGENEHR